METLLNSLSQDLNSQSPVEAQLILDDTGLPTKPPEGASWEDPESWVKVWISGVIPRWREENSFQSARDWFEKEFGVTFAMETRPVTFYTLGRNEP